MGNFNEFEGQIMQCIKSLSDFKDKKVVIAGFGKTALDMTSISVRSGALQTTHVFR